MQPLGNVQQVGGSHYGTKFGHWDYCKLAHTPYLEGAATKYLFRWRGKNGLEDLQKGLTFLEKLMAGMTVDSTNPDQNNTKHLTELEEMFDQNNIPPTERLLMQAIFTWDTYDDLLWAERTYTSFIEEVKSSPDGRYTNQG